LPATSRRLSRPIIARRSSIPRGCANDDDRILHPRRACANGGRRHLPGRVPTVPLHQRHRIERGRVHPHPIRRGLRVQRPRRVYAGLLGGGDVDVAGMCVVQCGDGGGGQQQDMQRAFQCRLCDILACCSDCPSERASECFPPNVLNGYTPTGWEPLSCDGSNASRGGGGSSSGSRRAVESSLSLAVYQ